MTLQNIPLWFMDYFEQKAMRTSRKGSKKEPSFPFVKETLNLYISTGVPPSRMRMRPWAALKWGGHRLKSMTNLPEQPMLIPPFQVSGPLPQLLPTQGHPSPFSFGQGRSLSPSSHPIALLTRECPPVQGHVLLD